MTNDLTRRDVLRRGAAATGAATVGVAGFSGTAAATLDCPRTIGYWKNHPGVAEQVRSQILVARGSKAIDVDEALSILNTPPRGDKALIMAKQVIAAVLSKGAILYEDGAVCKEAASDIDEGTLDKAINWLGCVESETEGWGYLDDPENYDPVRTWTNDCGDGEPLKDRLGAFNNGRLCDGCGGSDGGDGGDQNRENESGGGRGRGRGSGGDGENTDRSGESGHGRGGGNDPGNSNERGSGNGRGNSNGERNGDGH
ncbi:hypothetical protein G9464_19335 [Halostella sp. JP-L12]|uniref:hypothetical protein n=1 Tax=Halostella TaxID=1843185 RepID=UPI000EF80957|nr:MULTISPECIES: hypothetical protein [Halostella]NHN49727.1 hypothetical protein [Halostella sp. JP-L12]